jgi:hypothetical protein
LTGWVAWRRGRGCREVFSSTERTMSSLRRGRVSRSTTSATRAENSASRGVLGESHRWCRQGCSLWGSRMRRTVSGEICSTIPSRARCRASSRPSHGARERPRLSGRSHASLPRCPATAGGKDRLAAASSSIGEPRNARVNKAPEPLADDAPPQGQASATRRAGQALCSQPDDPRTRGQPCLHRRSALPVCQFGPFRRGQDHDEW